MSTIMETARRGEITPLMRSIAEREGVSPEFVCRGIASGRICAPHNPVHDPEPGFEKSAPAPGRALMTTRYCLLHELGLCRRQPHPPAVRLPLYLSNPLGRFLLDFDCRHCFMTVKSL